MTAHKAHAVTVNKRRAVKTRTCVRRGARRLPLPAEAVAAPSLWSSDRRGADDIVLCMRMPRRHGHLPSFFMKSGSSAAISPHAEMTTFLEVVPLELPSASIALTTSMPMTTLPKTTCFPSSHVVFAVHRKNCEPFVPGPALAIESTPGPVCLSVKFSSANLPDEEIEPTASSASRVEPPAHVSISIIHTSTAAPSLHSPPLRACISRSTSTPQRTLHHAHAQKPPRGRDAVDPLPGHFSP
mmetsp:Transcript_18531/g.37481  ORF Transcript_18531/g.37481 Transcript_18531/m.37481 type:complete len:241 (-) Transcript_18531:620-1342(-)